MAKSRKARFVFSLKKVGAGGSFIRRPKAKAGKRHRRRGARAFTYNPCGLRKRNPRRKGPDFTVQKSGGVVVWHALTNKARSLVRQLKLESWQMLGACRFAIDLRPSIGLIDQLIAEGYRLKKA